MGDDPLIEFPVILNEVKDPCIFTEAPQMPIGKQTGIFALRRKIALSKDNKPREKCHPERSAA